MGQDKIWTPNEELDIVKAWKVTSNDPSKGTVQVLHMASGCSMFTNLVLSWTD